MPRPLGPVGSDQNILRHLKATRNAGLVYRASNDNQLTCFTDADWAGDKVNRKSTSGVVHHNRRSELQSIELPNRPYRNHYSAAPVMVNLFSTGTKKKKESVVDDQQGNSATLRKPTSLSKQAMAKEMDELPQLRDYPAAKCADINIAPPDINIAPLRREALFEQKLELCSHVFNFEDVSAYTNHCFNHFFTGSIIEKREGD